MLRGIIHRSGWDAVPYDGNPNNDADGGDSFNRTVVCQLGMIIYQ